MYAGSTYTTRPRPVRLLGDVPAELLECPSVQRDPRGAVGVRTRSRCRRVLQGDPTAVRSASVTMFWRCGGSCPRRTAILAAGRFSAAAWQISCHSLEFRRRRGFGVGPGFIALPLWWRPSESVARLAMPRSTPRNPIGRIVGVIRDVAVACRNHLPSRKTSITIHPVGTAVRMASCGSEPAEYGSVRTAGHRPNRHVRAAGCQDMAADHRMAEPRRGGPNRLAFHDARRADRSRDFGAILGLQRGVPPDTLRATWIAAARQTIAFNRPQVIRIEQRLLANTRAGKATRTQRSRPHCTTPMWPQRHCWVASGNNRTCTTSYPSFLVCVVLRGTCQFAPSITVTVGPDGPGRKTVPASSAGVRPSRPPPRPPGRPSSR